jgi:hypothetical protein
VADKGGPPEYVAKNQERLVAVAKQLAEIAAEQKAQAEAAAAAKKKSG